LKRGGQGGKEKPLKDYDNRGEEGDGSIGGTQVRWFPRPEDWDNVSGLPNYGNISPTNGKVK
jgi:hypothetical protein